MREGIAIDQKDFIAACTTHAVICHVGTRQIQASLLVQGPSTWVSSLRGANIIASLQVSVQKLEVAASGTGLGSNAAQHHLEEVHVFGRSIAPYPPRDNDHCVKGCKGCLQLVYCDCKNSQPGSMMWPAVTRQLTAYSKSSCQPIDQPVTTFCKFWHALRFWH